MTQEELGKMLSISEQAISKWERGTAYPDIMTLPVLANLFGVGIDILFDYDSTMIEQKVTEIIEKGNRLTWQEKKPYEAMQLIENALTQYPHNLRLMEEALDGLCFRIGKEGYTDEFAERAFFLADEILTETTDVFMECSTKNKLASIYNIKGDYQKAKEIIHGTKNIWAYMLQDQMHLAAHSLRGQDRLGTDEHPGATAWKIEMIQELFKACASKGKGYAELCDYENALKSFEQAIAVIELFMKKDELKYESYLWDGMQTEHYAYYLDLAGMLHQLNRPQERDSAINKAWFILTHAWYSEVNKINCFEKNPTQYLPQFCRSIERNGLADVLPNDISNALKKCQVV